MSKVVTFRLDDNTIRDLDKVLAGFPQIDRSTALRKLIEGFVRCMSNDDRWRLLSSYDPYSDGLLMGVGFVDKKYIF